MLQSFAAYRQMDSQKLIRLIYERRALWDRQDPNHHHRFVLDKMWNEVATDMNASKKSVRFRWKSLRDAFRKEVQRIPETPTGDKTQEILTYDSTWVYFKSMLFLKDQVIHRAGSDTLPIAQCTAELQPVEDLIIKDEELFEDGAGDNWADIEEPSCSSFSSNMSLKAGSQKRYRRDDENSENAKKANVIDEGDQRMDEVRQGVDEDVSFFNSLLPHMKNLSPARKMLLRMKMQELVYSFVYNEEI